MIKETVRSVLTLKPLADNVVGLPDDMLKQAQLSLYHQMLKQYTGLDPNSIQFMPLYLCDVDQCPLGEGKHYHIEAFGETANANG